jgi:hypothetical protein
MADTGNPKWNCWILLNRKKKPNNTVLMLKCTHKNMDCRTYKCHMLSNGRPNVYKYRNKDFSVPFDNQLFRLFAQQRLYYRSSNRSKLKRNILIMSNSISNALSYSLLFCSVLCCILTKWLSTFRRKCLKTNRVCTTNASFCLGCHHNFSLKKKQFEKC